MKIKYLGTAAYEGFPGMFCQCEACVKANQLGGKNIRTRSGMLINDRILMDFGPDVYLNKLRYGLDLSKVTDILITHSHSDHFIPWDMLIAVDGVYSHYVGEDKDKQIQVFGNTNVREGLEDVISQEYGGNGQTTLEIIQGEIFNTYQSGEVQITPLLADHTQGEECWIYLIEHEGKTLLYGNDTGVFPQATFDYLAGKKLDVVSLDCTGGVHGGRHYHMGFEGNNEVKEKLEAIGCVHDETKFISTHFSHNCKMVHEELVESAKPYGFDVAYDGLEIHL